VRGAAAMGEREPCDLVVVGPGGGEVALRAEAVWNGPDGVGLAITNLDAAAKEALAALDQTPPAAEAETRDEEQERIFRNVHERVRTLSMREREDMARRGSMPERVALERAFGAAVWECLLLNPQITATEVARIAKNGTLARPLVSQIVNNGAWLSSPEVQRALLGNARCGGRDLDRVLGALKPSELARLASSCPYRAEVRQAAQRLATTRK